MINTSTKRYNGPPKACQDHLGQNYLSTREMLKHYNIPPQTYYRYCTHLTFAEILEKYKPLNTDVKDHLGKHFPNEKVMCQAHGVNVITYRSRIKKGVPLKDALIPFETQWIDHLGQEYNTEKDMCTAHKITHSTYLKRRKNKWSIKAALTEPINKNQFKDRTGETKISKHGQKMTITKYRGSQDIDVQFEDGQTVTTTYNHFEKSSILNPNLKTGTRIPKIAYTLIDGTVALYYKCKSCGLEDVGTWQQIAAHKCSDDAILKNQNL